MHAEGDYSAWSYGDTWLSGIYTARLGPPAGRSQSFAVNVDTRRERPGRRWTRRTENNVWPDVPFLYQTTWQQTDAQVGRPRRSALAAAGRLCFTPSWALLFVGDLSGLAIRTSRLMSGTLPAWLERWLGIKAGPGEGTAWRLEPLALAALGHAVGCVAAAVIFVAAIYLRESRRAGGRYRAALAVDAAGAGRPGVLMIAQFDVSLQRTGLPYVAVLVDDSLSMTIVDRYDEPLRKALEERRPPRRHRRRSSSAAGTWPRRC